MKTIENYLSPDVEEVLLEELGTIMQASPSTGTGERMDDDPQGWGSDFWN